MAVEDRLPTFRRKDYTDDRFLRDLRDMFDQLIAELKAKDVTIAAQQVQIDDLDARVTALEP